MASRASLVISIHANTFSDAPFANTPAITDPRHLQEAHLPPRAALEHSATRIIQQDSTVWGLQHVAAASPFGMKPAVEQLVLTRCFFSRQPRRDLSFGSAGLVKPAPASQFSQTFAYVRSHRDSRAGTRVRAEMSRGACRPTPLTGS